MTLPRIVYLDHTCPKPYDAKRLATEPMGGTEATVVRVAEALASRFEVIVAQHNRTTVGEGKASYVSFEALDGIAGDPKAVIAIRNPALLAFARERWNSPRILWCHDFNQNDLVRAAELLTDTRVVCVSNAHKGAVADALLKQCPTISGLKLSHIYNPVADDLAPSDATVYHRRLVFFSSPHKGLEQTLKVFEQLRRLDSHFELLIANPGYLPDAKELPEGVRNLGSLPHHEVIEQVRSALCVFHLNDVFPETFGLVHAEANAVGTAVLTSHRGANAEILSPAYAQMIDVRNEKAVADRVMKWAEQGRPAVACKPEFRLSAVTSKWEALINE